MNDKLKHTPILIVEDDPSMNKLLSEYLKLKGYLQIQSFFSGEELLRAAGRYPKAIIIQDYSLPGMSGLEVIRKVRSAHPRTDFIFLSGQEIIGVAMDALHLGAFDYIVKDGFAKENVALKIEYLLRIRVLKNTGRRYMLLANSILVLLMASWIILFVKYLLESY